MRRWWMVTAEQAFRWFSSSGSWYHVVILITSLGRSIIIRNRTIEGRLLRLYNRDDLRVLLHLLAFPFLFVLFLRLSHQHL